MYTSYYGLNEKPFENTPDPRFLYYSAQHEEALARMLYVIDSRKGIGMLTGIFGCGKTLVGQLVLSQLPKERYKIAFITNPRLDDIDLLRMIAYFLGTVDPPHDKADVLITLNNLLHNNMRDNKDSVIIIDEAHCIEKNSIFEELRLLLNHQLPDRFLLTLLLFGQPELTEKIEINKQLNQRIAIKYHLGSLDFKDVKGYIQHRLTVAGASVREIFSKEAVDLVYNYSGGIPRKINQICDMALFIGSGLKKEVIDAAMIEEAAKGLSG